MSNPLAYVIVNREQGTVENVVLATPQFVKDTTDEYAASGRFFVQIENVGIGWLFDADTGEFAPPEIPPKYVTADAAREAIYDAIDLFTEAVTGRVPIDEKYSWIAKEDAARAIVAGTESPVQLALLSVEASETGEAVDALAQAIIAKADQYRFIVAKVTGIRRNAEAALVEGADFDAIVAAAMASIGALGNVG